MSLWICLKQTYTYIYQQINVNHTHDKNAEHKINLVELSLINAYEKLILSQFNISREDCVYYIPYTHCGNNNTSMKASTQQTIFNWYSSKHHEKKYQYNQLLTILFFFFFLSLSFSRRPFCQSVPNNNTSMIVFWMMMKWEKTLKADTTHIYFVSSMKVSAQMKQTAISPIELRL